MLSVWRDMGVTLMHSPPLARQSSRKLYRNITLEVPGDLLTQDTSMTFESTGYTPSKVGQLKWHYLNQPTIDRCLFDVSSKLKTNKIGSGTFDFRGNVKRHVKADFCLAGAVATAWKDHIELDIFYRSTEFIKRFLGDVLFFKEYILPQLGKIAPVETVTFHFTNLTWHPMFAMYLLKYVDDWKAQLKLLKEQDLPCWEAIVRHNKRIFEDLHTDQAFNVLRRIQKYVRKHEHDKFMREFGKYVITQRVKGHADL